MLKVKVRRTMPARDCKIARPPVRIHIHLKNKAYGKPNFDFYELSGLNVIFVQWYPMQGIPTMIRNEHEPETEDYRDVVLKEDLADCQLPPNWEKDE